MSKPTAKQLKYCHDIAWRIGSSPCDEDGQPLYEKSFEAADAYIKANRNQKWSERQQKEFEDRNHPSDWGVPNY